MKIIRKEEIMEITNFNNFVGLCFCQVFKKYFEEIQVHVEDWDALFKDMNADERDVAKVLMEDGKIYGFIIYRKDELKNWFFFETIGFIREFWISKSMKETRIWL